jgi:hypothetical protein
VFFDVVNTSSEPIYITEIEAGAYSGQREASIFACQHGACRGYETDSSSWRTVWKGTLNHKSATSCVLRTDMAQVRLAPGEVQGFLLHSERDGVLYSSSGKDFKDAKVSVKPWYATSSSSPHGPHQGGPKYVPAGTVTYRTDNKQGPETATLDIKDLQIVFNENLGDVPAVEVHECIVGGARGARKVAAQPCASPALAPGSAAQHAATLAGGYRKGDRVKSLLDFQFVGANAKNCKISKGDIGTVVGPCEEESIADKVDRVFVDFGADKGRCHFLAKSGLEHAKSGNSLLSAKGDPGFTEASVCGPHTASADGSDVPNYPHDEASINETLYIERIRNEQSKILQASQASQQRNSTGKAKLMREDSSDFNDVLRERHVPSH